VVCGSLRWLAMRSMALKPSTIFGLPEENDRHLRLTRQKISESFKDHSCFGLVLSHNDSQV